MAELDHLRETKLPLNNGSERDSPPSASALLDSPTLWRDQNSDQGKALESGISPALTLRNAVPN